MSDASSALIPGSCIFDLETDGFLNVCTKIHSLVIWCDGEIHSFADHAGYSPVSEGLEMLRNAPRVYAHNGNDFDYPALLKLAGLDLHEYTETFDTMNMTRVMFPELKQEDMLNRKRAIKAGRPGMPGRLVGSHSLEAWGWRLGTHKGDFGKTSDWSRWSKQMQDYCELDVELTLRVVQLCDKQKWARSSLDLEHRFAQVVHPMLQNGIGFDEAAGMELYEKLDRRRAEVSAKLESAFPPTLSVGKKPSCWSGVTPDGQRFGGRTKKSVRSKVQRAGLSPSKITWLEGAPVFKVVPFNPGSTKQIAERLQGLGWEPTSYTKSGQPEVSDDALKGVEFAEAQLIRKYLLLQKRIGQLAEGSQAWLKQVEDGKLHGYVNTNGAVTGRCTHSRPNVAQVPSVATKKTEDGDEVLVWGEEGEWSTDCRALFGPTREGWFQVGADASGLELRVLAHYLGRWDQGLYARLILEADIHQHNRDVFGLEPSKAGRSRAKTGIYCVIYGGGDEKFGDSLGPLLPDFEKKAMARTLPGWKKKAMLKNGPLTPVRKTNAKRGMFARNRVMRGIEGFEKLSDAVSSKAESAKYLKGLDGRRLSIRKKHAALNTLLQSGGALIVKYATVIMVDLLNERGYVHGRDWALMAHIHDEIQAEARTGEIAKAVGQAFVDGLKEVERRWELRCPLDGDAQVGRNWAETH